MDSSLNDTNLFLLKRSRDLLRRNAEYKEVESSAKKTCLSLNDASNVGDDDVCIVTNDLPPTDQRVFVQYLAEHVRKDSSMVYVYAGYRFNYTKNGAITPVQKITRFDRRPFVARYRNNDNKEELVDVFTGETFACSGRVLNDILGIKQSGTSNEVISVACAELDLPIVCILPKRDWSGQPSLKSSNEVIAVFDTEEHSTVFSYKGWGKDRKLEALSVDTDSCQDVQRDPDSVAVIMTTHNRTETAKITIESLVKRLKYPKLHWFIADDRSDPGHVQQLVNKFAELGVNDVHVTETNEEHWGLGASLNNSLTAAFKLTDIVLTTEDDWYLQYDFDISKYVDVLKTREDVGAIRLGNVRKSDASLLDTDIPGFKLITNIEDPSGAIKSRMLLNLQVALRHHRLYKKTGLYLENKAPDVVESGMNERYIKAMGDDRPKNLSRMKLLWPSEFEPRTLDSPINPFVHFGESTIGHSYEVPERFKLAIASKPPVGNDSRIDIAFITDSAGIRQLYKTTKSLILTNDGSNITVHIAAFDDSTAAAVDRECSVFGNSVTLDIFALSKDDQSKLIEYATPVNGKKYSVPPIGLTKFMLHRLIDADRIIYLDTDTLVRKPISTLWKQDLGCNMLGGVVDPGCLFLNKDRFPTIAGNTRYFNSGVLVMNLEGLRLANFEEVLFYKKKHNKNLRFQDQDVLNTEFSYYTKLLPPEFNTLMGAVSKVCTIGQLNRLYGTRYKNSDDLIDSAVIWHWASGDKPWLTHTAPRASVWNNM